MNPAGPTLPENTFASPAQFLSKEAVEHNQHVSLFIQIYVFIATGCACGILGVTGLNGLVFFIAVSTLVMFLISFKMDFQVQKYFPSTAGFLSNGIFQSSLTFVLFWTLLYNIVHVY